MKKINVRFVCYMSLVAAMYVALTFMFTPLSYGAIQFRISEILVLLVLYKKEYLIPLILGCFVANILSPIGWVDIIFGTLATAISVLLMIFIKEKLIASLIPALINGLIIGLELYFVFELPFFLSAFQVFIGEFVVITIIGLPVMKGLESNEAIAKMLFLSPNIDSESIKKSSLSFLFAIAALFVVLFFALPIKTVVEVIDGQNTNTYIMLKDLVFNSSLQGHGIYYILIPILPIINIILAMLANKKACCVFASLFVVIMLPLISLAIFSSGATLGFNCLYFVACIIMLIINVIKVKKE